MIEKDWRRLLPLELQAEAWKLELKVRLLLDILVSKYQINTVKYEYLISLLEKEDYEMLGKEFKALGRGET